MKLLTPAETRDLRTTLSLGERVVVLGSCFADEMAARMKASGFDLMSNPFGTLYNPESILSAVERLDSAEPFTEDDCVEMGAGAGLVCSFSHHTSFARGTTREFLENANRRLSEASAFWKQARKAVITLGTAFVWRHGGKTVSNCLKRPAGEFTREMMDVEGVRRCVDSIISHHPGKEFIFTVSPIRHLGGGAHANTLSKATLQLGIAASSCGNYFDSYEILLDELRDYRFYADDMCHPSGKAVEYIWERFIEKAVPEDERERLRENERLSRHLSHRPLR